MQVKKILWVTFNPLPQFHKHLNGNTYAGSPWLQPLAKALTEDQNVELGIVCPGLNPDVQTVKIENITQFTIPIDPNRSRFFSILYPELLNHYLQIIKEFNPSIIHIHGTEKYFGLISAHVNIPVVVSIQGYVTACLPYLTGNISWIDLTRSFSLKNLLGKGGILNQKKNWNKYLAPMETKLIKQNQFFIGRTEWDKNHLFSINENATYFQGEELLRPLFYDNRWDYASIEKFSIFISNANYPLKGLHILLLALNELKNEFPEIKVKIPMNRHKFWKQNILWGNDYWRYLKSLIKKHKIENYLDFIGFQSEEGMATIFRKSHVFVMPSFIENSSNALGEAMITGTPCIVSNAGGLVDIIDDGMNGLVMENGNYKSLAFQIRRVFKDSVLAQKLSANGRKTALTRHDKNLTRTQYMDIYEQVIEGYDQKKYSPVLRAD